MEKEYKATNYESDLKDKQWNEIKDFFPSGNTYMMRILGKLFPFTMKSIIRLFL